MKKFLSLLLGSLLLAGCSSSPNQMNYVRQIDPAPFTVLSVSNNSKFSEAIPAGRYEFSVDEDNAGLNPARYSIYISDEEYDAMSENLERDLVNTVGPGQDVEINLKDGTFVYIAATSNKTGTYENGLTGPLEIESE